MYAIIREGDGNFYTSMVFGYYKTSDDFDYKNRFWIVLNKSKTALIKQHVLQQNTDQSSCFTDLYCYYLQNKGIYTVILDF